MSDAWYPLATQFWMAADRASAYPLRYGDVCCTPDLDVCRTGKGRLWAHVLVLHPSCELGAKAAGDSEVVVARVNKVSDIGARQQPVVRVGWAERDGEILVAHANTFWMPPLPGQGDDIDWYADFRRLQRVPLAPLLTSGRRAAMTHEARLHLIRRELYFKYRWLVDLEGVQRLEAARIAADGDFVGPRPSWA